MSNLATGAHSVPAVPPPSPGQPDFTELAQKLQEVAQVLLALSQTKEEQGGSESAETEAVPPPKKRPDQFRTYRIPAYIMDEEEEMLDVYGAEDWREVLYHARATFGVLADLMRNFDECKRVKGFFLNEVAQHMMMPPLDMLNRLCSVVACFEHPDEE